MAVRIAEHTKDYTHVQKLEEQLLAKHEEIEALIDAYYTKECHPSPMMADLIACVQNSSAASVTTTGDDGVPTFVRQKQELRRCSAASSAC